MFDYKTLSKEELIKECLDKDVLIASLECRSEWLECLEAAGVDNWCGYEYAQELHSEN